jgi:hypothetical protein
MADTKHHHAAPSGPVEGDGVSYSGIVWFVVILTVVTVVCQLLMWGLFAYLDKRQDASDVARSPFAAPQGQLPPPPNLLTDEPVNLLQYQRSEDTALGTYGWIDKEAGTVRLPIDRAKELLLQQGLPVRAATPPPVPETKKAQ